MGVIYSSFTPPHLECSSLYIYNNAPLLTRYELRFADGGETIYRTARYKVNHSCTINLNNLNIMSGTKLIVHASVIGGADSDAYIVLEYNPVSNTTAAFELNGITSYTSLYYQGTR